MTTDIYNHYANTYSYILSTSPRMYLYHYIQEFSKVLIAEVPTAATRKYSAVVKNVGQYYKKSEHQQIYNTRLVNLFQIRKH